MTDAADCAYSVRMDFTDADSTLGDALMRLPGIRAVAIGGSRASGMADAASDTDMYAFFEGAPPQREARARLLADIADSGFIASSDAFGPEDHLSIGHRDVEVVYLDLSELRHQVDIASTTGLMSDGFTTCFLYTVATCVTVDDDGSLRDLKERVSTYPAATRRRILIESPELLATFLSQMTMAYQRGDYEMVAHRRASIQATYFNMLFALNHRYHPGEKRLLEHTDRLEALPRDFTRRWRELQLVSVDAPEITTGTAGLVDELLALVRRDIIPIVSSSPRSHELNTLLD